jgi:hypothetical protein
MRMIMPSISTSMLLELRSVWRVFSRCHSRAGRNGNAVSTTAGTNCAVLRQPMPASNLRSDGAWDKRVCNNPSLEVLGELAPPASPGNHLQPTNGRHLRLKRMVKRRHKPISDSEIRTLADQQRRGAVGRRVVGPRRPTKPPRNKRNGGASALASRQDDGTRYGHLGTA